MGPGTQGWAAVLLALCSGQLRSLPGTAAAFQQNSFCGCLLHGVPLSAACLQSPGCVHHQQHVDPPSRAAGEEKRLRSHFCRGEGAGKATL